MRTYRALWLSDIHLGTDICQHEKLLKFLKGLERFDGYDVETLYLNGDIIDMTCMDHKIFWTKHRIVLKKLLRMADKGVKVVYVFGNHDFYGKEIFNQDYGIAFNGIKFAERVIHLGADGKRYLVLHGDQFDGMVAMHPWLYAIGDWLYWLMTKINQAQNWVRRFFKIPEWSFSLWLKTKTKEAVQFVSNFEQLITHEAAKEKVDGVICGHIHQMKDEMINGVRYLNSGCWTEFCSAIFETQDGKIEVKEIT